MQNKVCDIIYFSKENNIRTISVSVLQQISNAEYPLYLSTQISTDITNEKVKQSLSGVYFYFSALHVVDISAHFCIRWGKSFHFPNKLNKSKIMLCPNCSTSANIVCTTKQQIHYYIYMQSYIFRTSSCNSIYKY